MTEISIIVGLVAAFVGGFLCGANNSMFIKRKIADLKQKLEQAEKERDRLLDMVEDNRIDRVKYVTENADLTEKLEQKVKD